MFVKQYFPLLIKDSTFKGVMHFLVNFQLEVETWIFGSTYKINSNFSWAINLHLSVNYINSFFVSDKLFKSYLKFNNTTKSASLYLVART